MTSEIEKKSKYFPFLKSEDSTPPTEIVKKERVKSLRQFREMCAEATPQAYAALVEALDDKDGRVRIAAARTLFEFAFGRPHQSIDANVNTTSNTPAEVHARIIALTLSGEIPKS